MRAVVLRRLLWAVPMLFVVTFFSFVLVSLTPGDSARSVAGPLASEAQVEELRVELGLDRPMVVQYGTWLGDAVRGDLGRSVVSGASVTGLLNERLPATLSLIGLTTLVSAAVGIVLGTISAVRGGAVGRGVDVLGLVGYAVPGFWLALLLISWFAVELQWFPVTGYTPLGESPSGWLRSLTLPVVATAMTGVAAIAKQTRDSMLDVLAQDFVRVQQANGLPPRRTIWRHALRNAAIPVASVAGVISASLLSAAVLIETVFALPGLGSGAATAAIQRDLPLVQGAVAYMTIIVLAIGLLVDLSYAWLDPRVRTR